MENKLTMITAERKNHLDVLILLPILAVCVDLFTPYLIWKGILPSPVRWLSHATVAAMILVSILRMIGFDNVPRFFWFIVAIAMIWSYIAIGNGQEILPTIWGVWLLFQFPFVALFIYLQPVIPGHLPAYILKYGLMALLIEVIVQLVQYVSGVLPGDDIAGLFGKNGTGNLVLFNILICCFYLGHWITSREWKGLVIALGLCTVSSILGEMKLFLLAIVIIGSLAIILYALKYQVPAKMFFLFILLFVGLSAFVYLYNMIIPEATDVPIQTYIISPNKLIEYLNRTARFNESGVIYSNIGRVYAVKLGWNSLQTNPITFLFGYGLGTRSESQSLGTTGIAFATDDFGLTVGTSLLVIMQEMGIIGLALFAFFCIWFLLDLFRNIRNHPESPATGMRYALFLFSIFWLLWLWYATTWTMRVPMLLYWISVGYVLAEARMLGKQVLENRRGGSNSYVTII
jgi:hypothetical protein